MGMGQSEKRQRDGVELHDGGYGLANISKDGREANDGEKQ